MPNFIKHHHMNSFHLNGHTMITTTDLKVRTTVVELVWLWEWKSLKQVSEVYIRTEISFNRTVTRQSCLQRITFINFALSSYNQCIHFTILIAFGGFISSHTSYVKYARKQLVKLFWSTNVLSGFHTELMHCFCKALRKTFHKLLTEDVVELTSSVVKISPLRYDQFDFIMNNESEVR